jgi:DNA-binding Lrp family transcriptional regulator
MLPQEATSFESFPASPIELDDLDKIIIESLRKDGRQSNQEISRQTGASNTTIAARRRRMEAAGILRVRAVVDPYNSGRFLFPAHIGLRVEGGAAAVGKRLIALPSVAFCMTSLGSHDIVASVAASTAEQLSEILTETIPSLQGVQATEAWPVLGVAFHRSELVRFAETGAL